MQRGVSSYRSGITLPAARCASGPALLRGVRFVPHALPCPRLRGSHVRTFPARSCAIAKCAPHLSRAHCTHGRPDAFAPHTRCLRRT
eukprot:5837991-Pleurochrysis_carterae.AAC.1